VSTTTNNSMSSSPSPAAAAAAAAAILPRPTRRAKWSAWIACGAIAALALLICVGLALLFLWPRRPVDYPCNFIVLKLVRGKKKLTWTYGNAWMSRSIPGFRRRELGAYVAYLQRALDALPGEAPACGEWLVNIYDGHRERIDAHPQGRPDLPRLGDAEPHRFTGRIEIDSVSHEQPVFPLPLLAFCAHNNDATCTLLPDIYMERDQGIHALEHEKLRPSPPTRWCERIPKLVWRGGLNGCDRRRVFVEQRHVWANQPDAADLFDMGLPSIAGSLTIAKMAAYQLQLDVDGETNAWDALRWKLLSGGLVLKLRSHWKQWYYDDLIDGTHYVGIDTLEELAPTVRHYLAHPHEAERIGAQGRAFALARLNDTRCQVDAVRALRLNALDFGPGGPSGVIRCVTMQGLGDAPRWGRFGNQVFQYMFLRAFAWEYGVRTRFTSNWVGQQLFPNVRERATPNHDALRCPEAARGEQDFVGVDQWSHPRCPSSNAHALRLQDTSPLPPVVDLCGFFQPHTSHFAPHRARLVALFQLQGSLHARLRAWAAPLFQPDHMFLAVHIRRGDYGPPPFLRTPVAWYAEWVRSVAREHGGKKLIVYVASDEEAVINELTTQLAAMGVTEARLYNRIALDCIASRALPALMQTGAADFYPDFWVLTQAERVATSNSTFSVAACMLNPRPCPIFVRPRFDLHTLVPFDAWSTLPLERQ
jgi:hypothetical protein